MVNNFETVFSFHSHENIAEKAWLQHIMSAKKEDEGNGEDGRREERNGICTATQGHFARLGHSGVENC